MTLDDVVKILLSAGTLALGAFLTAVRGKLTATKEKNKLHYIFYVVSSLILISASTATVKFWDELKTPNWLGIIAVVIAMVASIALFWFTKQYLVGKYQYKTVELDPIINKFTKNSDKKNIRLLAGDLNFFGDTPKEMDKHSQYDCLKNEDFRTIRILCFKPKNDKEKIRYGKIIDDLRVELKYYDPPEADLNVRGRMKTLNNVTHLLIYSKVQPKIYEALELNTADTHGALYDHIWTLLWSMAETPSLEDINEYKTLHKNYVQ